MLNKETIVKQGNSPSPTFFNLYLHDKPELFKENQSDPPVLLDGIPIGSLLWADDLVILSNTEQGLIFLLQNWKNIIGKTSDLEHRQN